jgi:hypothetical protein
MAQTTEVHVSQIYPGTAYQLVGTNSGATQDVYLTLAGTTNQVGVATAGTTITLSTPQNINTAASPTFAAETLSVSGTSSTNLTIQNGNVSGSWGVFRSVGVDYFGLGFNTVPSNASNAIFYKSSIGDVTIASTDSHGVTIVAGSAQIAMDSMYALTTGVSTIGTSTAPFGNITTKGSLVLQQTGAGTNNISIHSPASVTSYSLTLPAAQGSSNSPLVNDGSGNLSWGTTVQVTNMILTGVTSDPGSPSAGQIWFRSDISQFVGYNGTTKVIIG